MERDSYDKAGEKLDGRRFRLEDARRKDWIDPKARTHKDHLLYAKLLEARHDMVRRKDEDDWMVRYFEAVIGGADPEEWRLAHPRGLVKQVVEFKTIDKKLLDNHRQQP